MNRRQTRPPTTDTLFPSTTHFRSTRPRSVARRSPIGRPIDRRPDIVVERAVERDRKSTRLNPVTNAHLVCRLLLEKKNTIEMTTKTNISTHQRHNKKHHNDVHTRPSHDEIKNLHYIIL